MAPVTEGQDRGAEFRQMLEQMGETQASFARWLASNGDDRSLPTIARAVRRYAAGEAEITGEMRVLISLRLRGQILEQPPEPPPSWAEMADGGQQATTRDGYTLTAAPQANGLWFAELKDREGDYFRRRAVGTMEECKRVLLKLLWAERQGLPDT